MLLNEFLKAHRKLEEQGAMIAEQEKRILALTANLKEQATEIKKVNARLAASQSDARLVTNE
jgi:septal ring factor EnvC (AmiA/AmiB activator)